MIEEAYACEAISLSQIEDVIGKIDFEQRSERIKNRDSLVSELYKLKTFDWGGLYQNSLERTIVNNYVKKIWKLHDIEAYIEGDLHYSLGCYVRCSWYNHWTSILIEDIFRDHENVIPAVGKVKRIDFFVADVPFDLKVTYLPEGYIALCRKRAGQKPESTALKQHAKNCQVPFENSLSDSKLIPDLWAKISDHPSDSSQELIYELKGFREAIIQDIKNDPQDLIRWLYENQGVARFDVSNRLFLVLIDSGDYFSSWKLKRAFSLLKEEIDSALDHIDDGFGESIEFSWDGHTYEARSGAIVVQKPHHS